MASQKIKIRIKNCPNLYRKHGPEFLHAIMFLSDAQLCTFLKKTLEISNITQLAITISKLTIETLEQGVKYVEI